MTHECITHYNACDCREAERSFQIAALETEIARLNHQHKNDEAANMLLQEVCEMQRIKLIELASGKSPVEPEEVYSPHTKVVE